MISGILKFCKKNYIILILAAILIMAAFLRIHRIQEYLTFLGDEGRDVLIVREILHGNLTFIGPRASAGDFFLGPIYYYFMAPFLLLANYSPVGPAIMVALFGVATVYLVYKIGREFFGVFAGLIAAALYAISPLVIQYSRSSWNPNLMPFFSILVLYTAYKGIELKKNWLFILSGLLLGITIQLHYLAFFLGGILFFFILGSKFFVKSKDRAISAIKELALIFSGFLIGLSPFLAFEVKHGFPNIKTIATFIIKGDPDAPDLTGASFFEITGDVFFRIYARLTMYFPVPEHRDWYSENILNVWYWGAVLLGVSATLYLLYLLVKNWSEKSGIRYFLIALWLIIGILLFGFYQKPIYDYYFGFMFPVPFLIIGALLAFLYKHNLLLKIFSIALFAVLLYLNWLGYPFRSIGNNQYLQVREISEFILDKAGGKPYNFALLTLGNSDHAYRYIFEVEGKPPVQIENSEIDPERKSVTDQLFVVCEDPNCQPLGASLWEVAGFGRAEIAGEWPVSVLKVYKLVPFE